MTGDVEIAVLTAAFTARPEREGELAAVLARYVVLTRGEPGCRNVDLLISATESGKFVVIEKWDSPDDRPAHLDTELMTAWPRPRSRCWPSSPKIDLLDTISAHDLDVAGGRSGLLRLLLAEEVDRDLRGAAVGGAGLLADLADARPRSSGRRPSSARTRRRRRR